MTKRYTVTEQDGQRSQHDDINQAIAKAGDGATVTDTETGKAYRVRKGGRHGDYTRANL